MTSPITKPLTLKLPAPKLLAIFQRLHRGNGALTSLCAAVFVILLGLGGNASAADEHLYQVTLLRASPGQLPALLNQTRAQRATEGDLLIMRHSQGDHWDLMLLRPAPQGLPQAYDYNPLVHYQHDFVASSEESWAQIEKRADGASLFHIEMFHAAAGKRAELLRQREMENLYYAATNRAGNAIFSTRFGSDVDSFTIGFYADLKAFASDPDLPPERFEQAAKDAGFTSRDTIGLYLRELIISHHDTLATRVD